MTLDKWYELRVVGSTGTSAGIAAGASEGISVGENGRLCALSSGGARRFESTQQALEYLRRIRISGEYEFEPVLCGSTADASRRDLTPAS